ncbi:MAG: hypothetical protein P8M49_04075 [Thalassotalea sp.]|nr:hypothetical protein [Thalassotalea sp.]MDG2392662.1 hypothetical protein [Thalassotalea sp.]
MNNTINMNNNNLNDELATINSAINNWLSVENNNSNTFFADKLVKVCQSKQQDKRWILCVDSEESDLLELAKSIDTSKLLRVNGQNKSISFDKIQRTLLKGNCSTVVLCESKFSAQELRSLRICAKRGNTQCIVVNKQKPQLH